VILNSPAWVGFPVQPSPGYQSSFDTRGIVGSADQLLTMIDRSVTDDPVQVVKERC